jgi:hypothetical protein
MTSLLKKIIQLGRISNFRVNEFLTIAGEKEKERYNYTV